MPKFVIDTNLYVALGRMSETGVTRSFFNDCLIAASAREDGFTIITDHRRDFERINAVAAIRFVAPWPAGT